MEIGQLKATIKCIHKAWYEDWMATPTSALNMHRHMEILFNFADIEESLVENNPDKVSPEKFKELTGAKE